MDKTNYQIIIDVVFSELKKHDFKTEKFDNGEYLTNGKKAFMIDYTDDTKYINFKTANLVEGEGVDWKTISTWLLEETADDKDKNSIANDFIDTAFEQIGLKASTTSATKIEMPSKKKKADSIDVESFTARFLAVFPTHKDEYKNIITQYGEFMYDSYFKACGVDELINVVKEGNKKRISKYVELLNISYINGEKEVEILVVYTIICGAYAKDASIIKELQPYLEKYPYLYKAVHHSINFVSKPANKQKYL